MLRIDDGREIAETFELGGDGLLEGPIARGEVGQVWKLTTRTGTFAVKEPFDARSADGADDEARFQDLAIESGVPAPAVIRAGDGRVAADIGTSRVRVYEWVDLRPADRALDPALVGAAVAKLHRVRYHGRNGLHPWYSEPVGARAWDSLGAELVAAGAPFADRLAERRDELVALELLLEGPTSVQTCHRDLFADNVLSTATGQLCIIDWENSGLADPSQELAVVLFEFAAQDGERARILYEAYRNDGGPGTVTRPESFAMAIAQLGHIGHHSASRWLASAELDDRIRNEARVDEFLTVGITRTQIDNILDSLAGHS
jgi:Ser/Thr protein kinase RdoA (MazF antagonist)